MIEVENITKRYQTITAIEKVTFTVNKGEILGFLGPNGAGKTTTMRILTCFTSPNEGSAKVAGFDCFEHALEVKKRIGYLPETPPLYQELTVMEYLFFVGRLKGLPSGRIFSRMDSVVEQVGLGEVRHRVIGHLSRGFRQRVGIAQALLHDPPVLILDEPTVGLDPKQINEIRELIQSLVGSHTILLSTHILPEATAICQRVAIIHNGRIVAIDSPERLSARLRESEKMSLTVKLPPPDWIEHLRAFPGVMSVFQGPTIETCLIECKRGHDIREELARFVVNQGIGLLELKTFSMSLEDVFLHLTRHDQAQPATEPIGKTSF